ASYLMSARGLKRNFKIELDRYHADQRYHGLKTINLNAGAMDPTKAREALSFAVFRAAGVPAPRTSYAQVTLTVPGKYDKELLGHHLPTAASCFAWPLARPAPAPAPLHPHAKFTLTVPEKNEKELLGLYPPTERGDRTFHIHHNKNGKELLGRPPV